MTGYKGKDALLTNSCSNRQNQRNSMKSSMKTFFLLYVCEHMACVPRSEQSRRGERTGHKIGSL